MNLKLFLFGLLIVCLPLFRQDFFVRHPTLFPLYFFLFPIGLLIMLWSVSARQLNRIAILLSACIALESGFVGSIVYMSHFQSHDLLPDNYYYWVLSQYSFFKNTTSFDPALSRYDSLLTYRFRPGVTGRFTNPEFNVKITSNSLGVRDDEASLRHPAVVVLGDSHAMGWGVEKHERFSEIIEKKLDVKVLNTAIASYGTHRESQFLDQVELDSCRLLIIQYCENDIEENKAYLTHAQKLGLDSIGFAVAANQNTINKCYFPFKGMFLGIRWLITIGFKGIFKYAPQISKPHPIHAPSLKSEHAKAFFPYLDRIREHYKGPILVFDLGMYNYPISKEFQAYQIDHPANETYFVNVHPLLSEKEYFTIDDHINARGHAKIGNALVNFIRKNAWLESR